jgi:hypothetical protein
MGRGIAGKLGVTRIFMAPSFREMSVESLAEFWGCSAGFFSFSGKDCVEPTSGNPDVGHPASSPETFDFSARPRVPTDSASHKLKSSRAQSAKIGFL